MKKCIIDIETTNLLAQMLNYTSFPYVLNNRAKLWCVVVRDYQTGEVFRAKLGECTREWLEKVLLPYDVIIAHNGIKFDFPALQLFGIFEYTIGYPGQKDTVFGREVRIDDSLILSRLANPDRIGGHGLEAWGLRVGDHKTDFREEVIKAGIIERSAPKGAEFLQWTPLMLSYCEQDTQTNSTAYTAILKEYQGWDGWSRAIKMEHKLADLAIKRETFGFWFDKDYALLCIEDLTQKMEELTNRVNPNLPQRPFGKGELDNYTPPKSQTKADGSYTQSMIRFADKVGGTLLESGLMYEGYLYELPIAKPLKTSTQATIGDLDAVKMHLIDLGWNPSEWRERDLTKDSKKQNITIEKRIKALDRWYAETMAGKYKAQRIEFLGIKESDLYSNLRRRINDQKPVRVPTSPTVRVGVEKELCPNLIALGEKVDFAKDFADYLTYRHRKSSIAGGDIEDMDFDSETPNTGYLSMYREEDGRVATPAIEIGASCVTQDTKIVTFNGLKSIVDVEVTDEVLTHTGTYKKVTDIINNGIKPVYNVKLKNGLNLTCTDNHPFWTPNGWVRTKDLKVNQEVFYYGETEAWGVHPNFKNYLVSSWGRVLNSYGKEMKSQVSSQSGRSVFLDLYDGFGIKHRITIGKLVCETFNGICPENLETRHLDGNSFNNNLQNLKFGTSKENSEDAAKHGYMLKIRKATVVKISDEEIAKVKLFYEENKNIKTTQQDNIFARKYGVGRRYIAEIRTGRKRNKLPHENLYVEEYMTSQVSEVTFVGNQPTFDITVKDDHSYVANSIVTHNTSRYRHIGIANIPRAGSTYGKEMRSLFGCGEGFLQFGYDFASLEARIEGHYVWDYTNGQELAISLLAEKPNDIHSVTGVRLGITRNDAKSINYAVLYGAQVAKLAKMLNISKEEAQVIYDGFWEGVPALKELKIIVEKEWKDSGKRFVRSIDGRKINIRSQHSILNALFQSAGVICAKYVLVYAMQQLEEAGYCIDPFIGKPDVAEMISYHDEAQLAVNPEIIEFEKFETEEEAKEFVKEWSGLQLSAISEGNKWYVAYPNMVSLAIQNSIERVEQEMGLNVNLGYEWIVNKTWYGCH